MNTRLTVLGLIFLSFGLRLIAQSTGAITGTVTDNSDAVVAAASVIIRDTGTGVERTASTNSAGQYVAEALPIGVYEVSVSAPGFKKATRGGIELNVAARLAINLRLAVGDVTETVDVTAEAPVVQTEKGDVSHIVSTRQITDLAVNGRTFLMLQQLVPGSSRQTGDEGGVGFNGSKGFAINGQRTSYSGLSLDGVENTDMGSQNGPLVTPGIETIGEFKMQTSNYSAEYGTAGGVNVLVVTRTGTRDFHGAAYEYMRNDNFDAKNFFAATKPKLRQHNFGYRIGGPVLIPGLYNRNREKTFFFWSQEWKRRRTQQIFRAATPTPEMRSGNFAAEAARIGRPILDPDTRQPFANNQIPSARLNRNAQLLLGHVFPQPNVATGFLNFLDNGRDAENFRQETLNVTHDLSGNTKLMMRYVQDTWVNEKPGVLWSSQAFPTISSTVDVPARNFVAKMTNIIDPTLLNEFSYSYGSNYGPKEKRALTLGGPFEEPQGLTIPRLFARIPGRPQKVPNLFFSGGWGAIDTSYYPWWAHHNITTITDIMSKTVGSHSLRFGGTWQFSKTPVESQVNPADQGRFDFDGSFSNHPVGDFILGRGSQYQELDNLLAPSYDYPQLELFAQDTWKFSSRLTLNLGVRYFYIPHVHEADNLINNFVPSRYDPSKAVTVLPNGTVAPGSGNVLNGIAGVDDGLTRGLVENYPWTFAPRLGFAWDPTGQGKTSVRGGYGIGYYRVAGNDTYRMVRNPPRSKLVSVFNPFLDNPASGQASADRPLSVNSLDPIYKVPAVQTYSLGIQRELFANTAIDVAYVGTRGTHLDRARDINQPLPVPGSHFDPRLNARTIPSELIRPFKGYGAISQAETTASSTYHSLQVALKRRMHRGLLFEAAYTWSRTIGDASGFGETPQDSYNAHLDRGLIVFDRPHMLILNYIYELPFLRSGRGVAGKLFGGWQLSGITQFQSGTPRNVGLTGATVGLANRPDVVAGASHEGPKTVQQWFNTAAFRAPAPGFFGNSGRNTVRGPGTHVWDLSIFKDFKIVEDLRTQFRVESFNAFNHPNFDGVSMALGTGNFGQVTSSRSARVMQFGLKMEF